MCEMHAFLMANIKAFNEKRSKTNRCLFEMTQAIAEIKFRKRGEKDG